MQIELVVSVATICEIVQPLSGCRCTETLKLKGLWSAYDLF